MMPLLLLIITTMAGMPIHLDTLSIAIHAKVVPFDAPLGRPLRLSLELTNVRDEPILLVAHDADFVVEIDSGDGIQTLTAPRYTRRRTDVKVDEVPLRPGDALIRELPVQLNDLRATLGEGWIPSPGSYRIRVRYDSERSVQERSNLAWRGSATSEWTDVYVRAPSESSRRRYLKAIETCIGSTECDGTEVANFFRVVREKRAPDLLLRLLEIRPNEIWLLDAIVFQGRASDAKRLLAIASRVDDRLIRQRFIAAAAKLSGTP